MAILASTDRRGTPGGADPGQTAFAIQRTHVRVAIVHDWLYILGGAERVLREMLWCYPSADVFTLFDVLKPEDRAWIGYESSKSSFLQRMPGISRFHRAYLSLMPLAIEQLDLSAYDLVLSSSCAVAKGVLTGPDQVHVAYVHSPMRYAWDMQKEYLTGDGLLNGLKNAAARYMLHRLRLWDHCSGQRPTAIVANSAFIARRIRTSFGREARVIYPPVDTDARSSGLPRARHFLAASRLVGYKNVQAVVEAFSTMPHLELVVAGTGPEGERLQAIAGPNVKFVGFVPTAELRRLMATARAFVFAAEEDFGIIPVEAQAEGTPVIALGRGGVRETVVADGSSPTGLFFDKPSAQSIAAAVTQFTRRESTFSPEACKRQAARFAVERFRTEFKDLVEGEVRRTQNAILEARAEATPTSRLAAAE